MSPILVRPVREQFEHDRVIRVLQARYKRKHEVAVNPGAEQNASFTVGDIPMYPDLLLYSQERGRRLQAPPGLPWIAIVLVGAGSAYSALSTMASHTGTTYVASCS